MSDAVNTPAKKSYQANLDGEVTALTRRGAASLLGLFAQLEKLAVEQQKEGNAQNQPAPALLKLRFLEEAGLGKISSRDLGRQMIAAARAQVRGLQLRTNEIQALVLINNWPVAERLWEELLAGCKTPLFELSLLEEMWGIRPERMEIGDCTLARHWHHFVLIQAEVEMLLLGRQSLLKLSDILEQQFAVWLKRFSEFLEKLDEESRT